MPPAAVSGGYSCETRQILIIQPPRVHGTSQFGSTSYASSFSTATEIQAPYFPSRRVQATGISSRFALVLLEFASLDRTRISAQATSKYGHPILQAQGPQQERPNTLPPSRTPG